MSFCPQKESISLDCDTIKDRESGRHSQSSDKDEDLGIEYLDTGIRKSSSHRKTSETGIRRGSQQSIPDSGDSGNVEIRCKSGSQKKRLSLQEADTFRVQLKHRDADKKAGLVFGR